MATKEEVGELGITVSIPTYGELLFERYLTAQRVTFQREPQLPGTTKLVDFVVDHPKCGKILLEVKDIDSGPPRLGFGFVDPYEPIRSHIEACKKKFKNTADYLCALVLAATPTSIVDLNNPATMMGAMYGDCGYQMPVNPKTGVAYPDKGEPIFIPGNGKMIRKREVANRRITAIVCITDHKLWYHAMRKYINTDNGRSRRERADEVLHPEEFGLPAFEEVMPGVTVWENTVATKKLPGDLFRGEMDAWWEVTEDGRQLPTFIGKRRRELDVDGSALRNLGMSQ